MVREDSIELTVSVLSGRHLHRDNDHKLFQLQIFANGGARWSIIGVAGGAGGGVVLPQHI